MKKPSKRKKISTDMFNVDFKKIDMNKVYKDNKTQYEKSLKQYEKDIAAEEKRVAELTCPTCSSVNKQPVVLSHHNGPIVYGGRNSVSILAEYNICQNCGNMYVDLKKKKIHYPEKPLFI